MPNPHNKSRRLITAVELINEPAHQSPYTPTWRAPARLTLEDGTTIDGFIHGRTKTIARKKAAELAEGITTPIFAEFTDGEFIGTSGA